MKMKNQISPSECKDIVTANKLNEQGVSHNGDSITIEPNLVILTLGHTTVKIPMSRFKMFAEWYLTKQDI